jgi:hypothetical protein
VALHEGQEDDTLMYHIDFSICAYPVLLQLIAVATDAVVTSGHVAGIAVRGVSVVLGRAQKAVGILGLTT